MTTPSKTRYRHLYDVIIKVVKLARHFILNHSFISHNVRNHNGVIEDANNEFNQFLFKVI